MGESRTLTLPMPNGVQPVEPDDYHPTAVDPATGRPAPRARYGPYDILTKAELAAFFEKSERTIERMGFPSFYVGRDPFYRWLDVVNYTGKQVA